MFSTEHSTYTEVPEGPPSSRLADIVLRLRSRLKSRHPLTVKELTEQQFHDYVYLFCDAAQRVFTQRRDSWKVVEHMTKPLIELPSVREGRLHTMLAERESKLAEKNKENSDLKSEIGSLKAEIERSKNAEGGAWYKLPRQKIVVVTARVI